MILLTTNLTGCKPSVIRTDKKALVCENEGTKSRDPIVEPPTTRSDSDYHKWAGALYRDYLELYKQDTILLNCWNEEQKKRAGN